MYFTFTEPEPKDERIDNRWLERFSYLKNDKNKENWAEKVRFVFYIHDYYENERAKKLKVKDFDFEFNTSDYEDEDAREDLKYYPY